MLVLLEAHTALIPGKRLDPSRANTDSCREVNTEGPNASFSKKKCFRLKESIVNVGT